MAPMPRMVGMSGTIPTLAEVDELHRRIAPSQAAYDLIHTHCVIIATIAGQLAARQNALFMRRCTLPAGSYELAGRLGAPSCATSPDSPDSPASPTSPASPVSPASPASSTSTASTTPVDPSVPTVPPSGGVTGGRVPPRLIDRHLVEIGALLHDIGTYRVLLHDGSDGGPLAFDGPNYVRHGILGYEYLLEQGVDESIAQFARNHTGVGLTRDAVVSQHLPLPPDDYVPTNLEQEVVMVADKYHSKSIPPKFLTVEAYTRKAARFGEQNSREWLDLVAQYGVPDVASLAERYHMRLKQD